MKSFYTLIAALAITLNVNSQNTFPTTGTAGIVTAAPNASSLLDIKSAQKEF